MKRIKISQALMSSIMIALASFITQGINLITTPIFTRVMSVEEYGLVAQYNSWLNIITVFATLSLSAGVFQVAMSEFPNDRDRFTFSTMILSNISTVVVFVIVFAIERVKKGIFDLPVSLLILMFLYTLFSPAMSLWLSRQRYEYSYKKVFIISSLSAIASQLVSLICVLSFSQFNLGEVKLWSSGLVMILFSIGLYASMAIKVKFSFSLHYMKYALLFNLPLLIHYLAQYALRSTDKIMITSFWGVGATGIYSLGATIANIAIIAWSAIAASLTPYIYENLKTHNYKKINDAVLGGSLFFGVCCLIVAFIGPEVVYVLGSSKYMEGIYLIPPIAASCLLQAIYSHYASVAFYYHKRISTSVMTIVAAVINLGLNYVLIPRYGYVAAAYTTEIAYIIYTILHYLNYRRIVQTDRIYNDKAIWGMTVGITICCLGAALVYENPIIRYSVILIMFVVAFVFRKRILNIALLLTGKEK
jgi:O-antigen/teichoic acid export membrane protein